ncbi:Zn-dependent amino-or carboxypeptidase, M28 family [Actinokineospora alba]|uniref:Zn-dependent amino-or carboxypeptidase, M28 family n=1 Tax=Actinokineospora alba TaxID=504798 RepID=A0A1H0R7U1_9PSEU|nr:M28 family peptidase [Actinokineospora alba]TDP70210.1 Zn-dependent M28 family amino/carboxypeptidase [Actinokineospora alba]SDI36742.1 Zn-dependent amino-or carboxypeptidase, M28 family [Actinokineospora alba]SDP25551.1 Zn-dependent amino-or carboxypeptidase, M28 family [Actinokineospora alba]
MRLNPLRSTGRSALAILAVTVAMLGGTGPVAGAAPEQSGETLADTLVRKVSLDRVNRHLIAFQRFADRAGGTRAAYTGGYRDSLDYVADKLREAGFVVETPEFTFDRRVTDAASVVAGGTSIEPFPIIHTISTPAGGVTGRLVHVPVDANPGCDAADYAGLDLTGGIALIKRGGCTFTQKQALAADAGALAAVIYNQLEGPPRGILAGGPTASRIPTGLVTMADGAALVALAGTTTTVDIRTHIVPTVSHNLIAQTRTGRADNVVLAGAQLDSEDDVPGINDNATGAAALLEVALKLGGSPRTSNAVRFAFWGAEWTQSGSRAYLDSLDFEAKLDISMYLHFDMLGSLNAGHFVYDGDDSDRVAPGPRPYGCAQIEKTFLDFYSARGIPTEGTNYDANTDHPGFVAVGIPTGGIYGGSFTYKSATQAAKWGGQAGAAFDPNHQTSKDNLGNVNPAFLDRNADAIAYAIGNYATSTEDVNGVPPRAQRAAAQRMAKSATQEIAPAM